MLRVGIFDTVLTSLGNVVAFFWENYPYNTMHYLYCFKYQTSVIYIVPSHSMYSYILGFRLLTLEA